VAGPSVVDGQRSMIDSPLIPWMTGRRSEPVRSWKWLSPGPISGVQTGDSVPPAQSALRARLPPPEDPPLPVSFAQRPSLTAVTRGEAVGSSPGSVCSSPRGRPGAGQSAGPVAGDQLRTVPVPLSVRAAMPAACPSPSADGLGSGAGQTAVPVAADRAGHRAGAVVVWAAML
jgi:hypothetical protein